MKFRRGKAGRRGRSFRSYARGRDNARHSSGYYVSRGGIRL